MTTMTYVEWARERACSGKRSYPTRKAARKAADASATQYRQSVKSWGTYRCWFCGMFHIGHKGKGASRG